MIFSNITSFFKWPVCRIVFCSGLNFKKIMLLKKMDIKVELSTS